MRKVLLSLCLISIIGSMSAQASCIDLYREQNNMPTNEQKRVGALLSTTGALVIAGGLELASATSALGVAILADENGNILTDLIAMDIMSDASSSATNAVYYGSSSTLVASGVLEGGANYTTEIDLLEQAQLAPTVLGSTLLELTDDINDLRSANEGKVDAAQVAQVVSDADLDGDFCPGDRLMNAIEMRDLVDSRLR